MNNNVCKNQRELVHGLKNGKSVHISEVSSGLACKCICGSCKAQLVAKKGPKNAHSFAHHKSKECQYAVETSLHMAAKRALEESVVIVLPELIITETVGVESREAIVGERHIAKIDSVVLEHRLHDIIPDVIAYINGQPFIIEIAVTHDIDEIKLGKIQKLGISCIQIKLSNVDRDIDFETIRSIVIDSIAEKQWIFHSDEKRVRAELRAVLELELQSEDVIEMKRLSGEFGWRRKTYAQEMPRSPIWRRATNNMSTTINDLPDWLNQPVKGECVFACDRRVWQAGLFSALIYRKSEECAIPDVISITKMAGWCRKYIPLNKCALQLWTKKNLLQPDELNLLYDFDLYGAIRKFASHLESLGIIRSAYKDCYRIIIDRLPSDLVSASNDDFRDFSCDELKYYEKRSLIMEFCGGLTRNEAEKLAYAAILGMREPISVFA